jgi:hypothetical protein
MKNGILIILVLLAACKKPPVEPNTQVEQSITTNCKRLLTGFFDLEACQTYWFNESNLDQFECNEGTLNFEVFPQADMIIISGNFDFCENPIQFWTHDLFYEVDQYCEIFLYQATVMDMEENHYCLKIELDDNFLTDCPTSERGGFYFAVPFRRLP